MLEKGRISSSDTRVPGDRAQLLECLSSMHEALGSLFSTAKNENKIKKHSTEYGKHICNSNSWENFQIQDQPRLQSRVHSKKSGWVW